MVCCLTINKYQQTHNTLASLAETTLVVAVPAVAVGTSLNLGLVSQARTEFKQRKRLRSKFIIHLLHITYVSKTSIEFNSALVTSIEEEQAAIRVHRLKAERMLVI
jgi:hypothetical protein